MGEKVQRKGLGTGLSALFGESLGDFTEKDLTSLPISKVEPNREQPRAQFDEVGLEELAESIVKHGLIQPITVRKLPSGYYQIIAGERRWRAARKAGLSEILVRIIEADDRRAAELALVENLQREDLNPIEQARGFKSLMTEYGLTQEEVAESVGKSRPAVANALRLLSLCPQVSEMLENGLLSMGHARALIPIPDPRLQADAAAKVSAMGLSVRQTESLAAKLMKEPAQTQLEAKPAVDYVAEVERELEKVLGRKVYLTEGKKKGKIELEYYGADDREALIQALLDSGRRA